MNLTSATENDKDSYDYNRVYIGFNTCNISLFSWDDSIQIALTTKHFVCISFLCDVYTHGLDDLLKSVIWQRKSVPIYVFYCIFVPLTYPGQFKRLCFDIMSHPIWFGPFNSIGIHELSHNYAGILANEHHSPRSPFYDFSKCMNHSRPGSCSVRQRLKHTSAFCFELSLLWRLSMTSSLLKLISIVRETGRCVVFIHHRWWIAQTVK